MQIPKLSLSFFLALIVFDFHSFEGSKTHFTGEAYIYIYIYILEVYRSSASADIRMNFDIRIRNISCGCHADIANNKRIIF